MNQPGSNDVPQASDPYVWKPHKLCYLLIKYYSYKLHIGLFNCLSPVWRQTITWTNEVYNILNIQVITSYHGYVFNNRFPSSADNQPVRTFWQFPKEGPFCSNDARNSSIGYEETLCTESGALVIHCSKRNKIASLKRKLRVRLQRWNFW